MKFRFLALCALVCTTGCASMQSSSNYGGRSGIQQKLLSETMDESVSKMGINSRFTDRKVYVYIGDLDAEGVVNDYVQASVKQQLLGVEAIVTENAMEADEQLIITVRAAGVDHNDPPKGLLQLLYSLFHYQEKTVAVGVLEAVSVNVQPGTGRVTPNSAQRFTGESQNTYTENWYLFGILGPNVSTTVDNW